MSNNPLKSHFRAPKLFTRLPSGGTFYNQGVVQLSETGELEIYAMTSRDEVMMRNPDALLNGESVAQIITSCVPQVKKARELLGADVDALMVAIQGATFGDQVNVEAPCPECGNAVVGAGSVQASLATMKDVPQDIKVETDDGLTIELRPVTYETTIAAGVSNFQNARSMQSIATIEDDLEKLRAFNESYMKMAELNFLVILDSIYSISGTDENDEEFIVSDRDNIREYMENCVSEVGKKVTEKVNQLSEAGIDKTVTIQCQEEACGHIFETKLEFDPVNFSTAS
jgi:hypothetical protein